MRDHITIVVIAAAIIIISASVFLIRRFASGAVTHPLASPEHFARLLVAEIRMYRGQAVETASRESAIYRLLKEDIDRSRKMFLQRYPAAEAVFYSALVAVLAHGEANALGPEYPYSRHDHTAAAMTDA